MPADPNPPPKKLTLKAAEFESVNTPTGHGGAAVPDPLELLRQNREHEKAHHSIYDQSPAPVKRRSRRNREYLAILLGANLIFALMLFYAPIVALAMMAFFSGGWTWVMLVCFDDY
ncbi:MAG TPA: hypothetical protein VHC95_10905 [Opitutales bacterium]|nr:hypothetical protein [Opitutales bacterium]